jgi:DNA-binding MarR family transcriptional regulator
MREALNYGNLLVNSSRLFQKRFAREAAPLGVTLAASKALDLLASHEGITQARLATLCDVEPMALVRMLDRMQTEGWVERRMAPTDRRAKCLFLTAKANGILTEIRRIGRNMQEGTLAGVSPHDLEAFERVLEHLHRKLSEDDRPACNAVQPAKLAARARRS